MCAGSYGQIALDVINQLFGYCFDHLWGQLRVCVMGKILAVSQWKYLSDF